MKTMILIGALGKIGQAAAMGLGNHKVITNEQSIRALYEKVGHFDAVVNTVGLCDSL